MIVELKDGKTRECDKIEFGDWYAFLDDGVAVRIMDIRAIQDAA